MALNGTFRTTVPTRNASAERITATAGTLVPSDCAAERVYASAAPDISTSDSVSHGQMPRLITLGRSRRGIVVTGPRSRSVPPLICVRRRNAISRRRRAIGQDGEHATVVLVDSGRASLPRIERTSVSTVFSVSQSRIAIPEFIRPSAIRPSTSCSLGVGAASGSASSGAADQRAPRPPDRAQSHRLRRDGPCRGSRRRRAPGHSAGSRSHRRRATSSQGMAGLDVLRRHQHGGARETGYGSRPRRACPRRCKPGACGRRRSRVRASAPRRRPRATSASPTRADDVVGRRPRAGPRTLAQSTESSAITMRMAAPPRAGCPAARLLSMRVRPP